MATTKKTAAAKETATKTAAKTEEKKAAAATTVKETATKTTKAAEKKTAEKKTAAKTTKKAEEKKPVKKTTTKKTPSKKATKTAKATETAVKVFVEFNGATVALEDVINNVKIVNGKDAKEITVYLKPEDQKAYFVADGEEKEMDVFFC